MTKGEFVALLEHQLEMPPGSLKDHRRLSELDGWDSMAAVIFIALADEKLGVTLSGNDIAKAKKVDELLSLLGDRLVS